jgi:hypothetical protein
MCNYQATSEDQFFLGVQFIPVGEDGFFFKIAYEAMTSTWADEVGDEHGVEEDALSTEDCEAHEPARFAHLVDVLVNAF